MKAERIMQNEWIVISEYCDKCHIEPTFIDMLCESGLILSLIHIWKSGLKDKELGAALGWLAREDKIEVHQEEDELYVSLGVNVYICLLYTSRCV